MTLADLHPTGWLRTLTTAVFGPDHPGADDTWPDQLRTTGTQPGRHRTDDTPTAVMPAIRRRPAAALTAHPHWPVIDPDLGPLVPGPLEPAVIADHLAAVNGVNTGGVL
ncbi:hypothetical protein OG989_04235 [Micromonospora sp. NBC_01740]|uniref:hypothetical protein n=1 Tax=Micromonospora sp. NBC_01740 TaxID=2975986 RepID=UPI002E138735|nr:hypothetical protein OG989_04235 [Micromonospora sp. NBC_01740]